MSRCGQNKSNCQFYRFSLLGTWYKNVYRPSFAVEQVHETVPLFLLKILRLIYVHLNQYGYLLSELAFHYDHVLQFWPSINWSISQLNPSFFNRELTISISSGSSSRCKICKGILMIILPSKNFLRKTFSDHLFFHIKTHGRLWNCILQYLRQVL